MLSFFTRSQEMKEAYKLVLHQARALPNLIAQGRGKVLTHALRDSKKEGGNGL